METKIDYRKVREGIIQAIFKDYDGSGFIVEDLLNAPDAIKELNSKISQGIWELAVVVENETPYTESLENTVAELSHKHNINSWVLAFENYSLLIIDTALMPDVRDVVRWVVIKEMFRANVNDGMMSSNGLNVLGSKEHSSANVEHNTINLRLKPE